MIGIMLTLGLVRVDCFSSFPVFVAFNSLHVSMESQGWWPGLCDLPSALNSRLHPLGLLLSPHGCQKFQDAFRSAVSSGEKVMKEVQLASAIPFSLPSHWLLGRVTEPTKRLFFFFMSVQILWLFLAVVWSHISNSIIIRSRLFFICILKKKSVLSSIF